MEEIQAMKKIYIKPIVDISDCEKDIMITTSISYNGHAGSDEGGDAKQYSFSDFDFSESPELKCDLETDISKGVSWSVNNEIFQ